MKAANDNGKPRTGQACNPGEFESQMVYVVTGRDDVVKIGNSTNVYRRMQELSNEYSMRLRLVGLFLGGNTLEGMLHRHFARYHISGEWFEKTGVLSDWIDGGCPDVLPIELYAHPSRAAA